MPKIIKILIMLSLSLTFAVGLSAQLKPTVEFEVIEKKQSIKIDKAGDKIAYYKQRYGAEYLSDKITDNKGNGYEKLYGTRNLRPILHGVAYRGGGNNYYHKSDKRKNNNPLPDDGLRALADEGFSAAVYLYKKNFKTAPVEMLSSDGKDTLKYLNNTLPDKKSEKKIVEMVYKIINNNEIGPIYLHCWNGWHQSGYISAVLLMQFCDYGNSDALEYWKTCTDNNHKKYDHIKKRIMKFKKFEGFEISKEMKAKICPKPVRKKK